MDRKVIVVPKHGDVFERDLVEFSDKTLERHHVGFREFIEKEKIEFDGYVEEAGYNLAIYLISMGNVVFQIDNHNVIFLPDKLSSEQDSYFRGNRKYIKSFGNRLSVLNSEDGVNYHYDESNLDGISPFHKLEEIIDEKEIVKENIFGKVMRKCIKD